MSAVLSIADLVVRFGGGVAAAVDGVSLELRRGEIFGLV
jgi:ABC-type dipeptide/oligopeptide/nickel transport system ATPase component